MKKIYSRPTLAAHGGATSQTKGRAYGDYDDPLGYFRRIVPD